MTNWRFRPISRFLSKTVKDTAIVTMEDQEKLVRDLVNVAISSDLERLPTNISTIRQYSIDASASASSRTR